MQIDSRAIRLGKWNVPRNARADCTIGDMYYALGYFDIIGIEKIEENRDTYQHPLEQAYEYSYRLKDDFQSDFFVQEIKSFTNISEDFKLGFSDKRIKEFWETDSLVLCFSMLQLYWRNDIDSMLDRIREVFSEKNYLYYFTLDYSGIILLAKDISIKKYMELLFKINYDNKKHVKYVKDTFSIYGLKKEKLLDVFKNFFHKKQNDSKVLFGADNNENYEIAVNISVQNYSAYLAFKEELGVFEKENGCKSEAFELSGRHDISIVNRCTNIGWLLFVQFLLDKYTQNSVGDFYSYESFIKVSLLDEYSDCKCNFNRYQPLIQRIENSRKVFEKKAIECGYISYYIPMKEVCASIISILNNGFAEDFVICMFQPFCEFLEYLESKMEEELKGKSKDFDRCFCSYFDGLNALVNSAMHTDRQFIRATSFSNIFYDVPPKIMAFYIAIIYRTREIMQTEGEKRYTFFMSPSFSDEVSVKIISYDEEEMPCDRILRVSINERSLYNPKAVIRRMSHEIAHFVGGRLRKRPLRMEKIINTLVNIILQQVLHEDFKFGTVFMELQKTIVGNVINNYGIDCEKDNYSNDLKSLNERIIDYLLNAEIMVHEEIRRYILGEIEDMLREGRYHYFTEIIKKENRKGVVIQGFYKDQKLTQIQKEYLSKLVLKDIVCEMSRLAGRTTKKSIVFSMGETILKEQDGLKTYVKELISLYSETYADLQMILILGISYEEYLKGFVKDEKIDVLNVGNTNEDISRIAVISQLLQENQKWEKRIGDSNLESLKILHTTVKEFQIMMEQEDSPYRTQNQNLIDYLKACMEISEEYYEKNEIEICRLRDDIKILVQFNDAKEVYSTICRVVSEYCQSLVEESGTAS